MSTPVQFSSATPNPDERASARQLRLKLISRRFWPYAGAAEFHTADLARALSENGHAVELLTIRWDATWPVQFRYEDCLVQRLRRPSHGPWGSYRYLKNLQQHITSDDIDGVVLMGLGEELVTVDKATSGRIPFQVMLSEMDLGIQADVTSLSNRQLHALRNAAQVVVESRWSAERLAATNELDPSRIVVASDGICTPPATRTLLQKNVARRALADAHPMLAIPENQPLVICHSPMVGDQGMIDLVHAWKAVDKMNPNARLWMIGEGPRSREIWDTISEQDLGESIVMPGQFDDLSEIFQAADIIVHPLRSRLHCGQLLRGMAFGVRPLLPIELANQLDLPDSSHPFLFSRLNLPSLTQNLLAAVESIDSLSDEPSTSNGPFIASHYAMEERIETIIAPFVNQNSS